MILAAATAQIDLTAIISSAITAGISIGVTGWVYKVQNNIIKEIRRSFEEFKNQSEKKVKDLEAKVKELEDSENKWYRKYHELKLLIARRSCKKENCPVQNAYDELMSKTGES